MHSRLIFWFSLALVTPLAAAPQVFPTPQDARWSAGPEVRLKGEPKVVLRADSKESAVFNGVPAVSGAYRLSIAASGVTVAAHDARGAFYAKQTLRQVTRGGSAPQGVVTDWPDLAHRGTVEGFYGQPWSHEARLSQLRFYGEYKMNTYIYGPKDDPFHSSPNWRKPYPDNEARKIRELVTVARENQVDFVWAIHPGKDIKWTAEDMGNVKNKFGMMYDLGVRAFAVFFDDIGGEGTRAEKQAELLNLLHREFVVPKGDVLPLIVCPTEYNRSWSNPKPGTYLDVLGESLDPSIHVMWTGNTVVHDITLEGQEWVNKRLRRPSYVWWNFPVSDFVRNRLLLGRVYGLDQSAGAKASMSGFVSNPMDKPEASKIGLFGVADYCWNIRAFDSDRNWHEAVRRVFPGCAGAMQVFADHNSDHGPNFHGYRREESVAIAPTVSAVLAEARKGEGFSKAPFEKLRGEFSRIEKAPAAIRTGCANPAFLDETKPWLDSFGELGRAGGAAMDAIYLTTGGKPSAEALSRLLDCAAALEEKDRVSKITSTKPGQSYHHAEGVKTGTLVMEPAVRELAALASGRILRSVSGGNAPQIKASAQGGQADGLEKIHDGDPKTFWHSGSYQKTGDWYALDFGVVMPVRTVDVLLGRNDKDTDVVKSAQLEFTADGRTWQPLGGPLSGMRLQWQGKPVMARGVRCRLLDVLLPPGGNNPVWTAIREFSINQAPPPSAESTIPGLANLQVQVTDKLIRIAEGLEVVKMPAGATLSLVFPQPVDATWVEVNFDDPGIGQWAEVMLETSEKPGLNPIAMQPQGNNLIHTQAHPGVRRMVVRNKGSEARDIKLKMFKVDAKPQDHSNSPARLVDGDLTTSCALTGNQPVELSVDDPAATRVHVIGRAACGVSVQDGTGNWKPIGSCDGKSPSITLTLPKGSTAIRIAPAAGAAPGRIHELVFGR